MVYVCSSYLDAPDYEICSNHKSQPRWLHNATIENHPGFFFFLWRGVGGRVHFEVSISWKLHFWGSYVYWEIIKTLRFLKVPFTPIYELEKSLLLNHSETRWNYSWAPLTWKCPHYAFMLADDNFQCWDPGWIWKRRGRGETDRQTGPAGNNIVKIQDFLYFT